MKNVGSRPPNVGDGSKAFFIAHLTVRETLLEPAKSRVQGE